MNGTAPLPPQAWGDSNPVNGECLLCGEPTGGVLCGGCAVLPFVPLTDLPTTSRP